MRRDMSSMCSRWRVMDWFIEMDGVDAGRRYIRGNKHNPSSTGPNDSDIQIHRHLGILLSRLHKNILVLTQTHSTYLNDGPRAGRLDPTSSVECTTYTLPYQVLVGIVLFNNTNIFPISQRTT